MLDRMASQKRIQRTVSQSPLLLEKKNTTTATTNLKRKQTSTTVTRVGNNSSSSSNCSTNRSKDRIYVEPTDDDILRGRGGRINSHPGKQRLLDLVRNRGAAYASLKRGQKGKMGEEIVEAVYAWGGRFLELEKDNTTATERYFVLDKRVAVKLVEQKFRDDPTKRKPKNNKSNDNDSISVSGNTQSKQAIAKQRKGKNGGQGRTAASQQNDATIIAEGMRIDEDEDESLIDMELHRDIFTITNPASRLAIAAQVNRALLNLEPMQTSAAVRSDATAAADVVDVDAVPPTRGENEIMLHCVSPTHSMDDAAAEQQQQQQQQQLSVFNNMPLLPIQDDFDDIEEHSFSLCSWGEDEDTTAFLLANTDEIELVDWCVASDPSVFLEDEDLGAAMDQMDFLDGLQ